MPSTSQTLPERLTQAPLTLVRQTLGGRREVRGKLKRLGTALRGYGDNGRVESRLRRLQALGHIDAIPTRTQRVVGAIDMLRFFIVPCAKDYYASKNINYRFHTLLRVLDDPASMIDPTGLNSSRDAIIGHVMQVVHANPHYDFQLLEAFEDGLDEMERQVEQVIEGTHPRTASIRAIVEDPDYHHRLLEHIRVYRANPKVPPMLRENVERNPAFRAIENTFGTVPNAMRYFTKMPKTVSGALAHFWKVKAFPTSLVC